MRQSQKQSIAILLLTATVVLCPQFVEDARAANDWTQDMIKELDRVPSSSSQRNVENPATREAHYYARGDEAAKGVEPAEPNVSGGFAGMFRVLSIALIFLGLGYGLLMLVRKIRRKKDPTEETGSLKLVESLWLGKGQRVMLVHVAGQQVLLGASGGSLQSLAVLDGGTSTQDRPKENAANDDFFPAMLKSEMKDSPRSEPTYGRTGRLETREEELQPSSKVSNERVKQILKRLNHL